MPIRGILLLLLALMGSFVLAQGTEVPGALQFTRTVNLPLSRAQVAALVNAAWENSFALDPGAKLGSGETQGPAFEGSARIAFRSEMVTGREQSAGNIHYRVSILAENGTCQVRVSNIRHTGSTSAKQGPIDIGILREQAPADFRLAGLSRSNAIALHNEARDLATARLQQLLGRFESTLRDRAAP